MAFLLHFQIRSSFQKIKQQLKSSTVKIMAFYCRNLLNDYSPHFKPKRHYNTRLNISRSQMRRFFIN